MEKDLSPKPALFQLVRNIRVLDRRYRRTPGLIDKSHNPHNREYPAGNNNNVSKIDIPHNHLRLAVQPFAVCCLSMNLVAPPGLEPGLSALKGPRVNQLHHGATHKTSTRQLMPSASRKMKSRNEAIKESPASKPDLRLRKNVP